MDPELKAALEALADYVFATDEPNPRMLEERRRALPPEYVRLASLFLNVRLALRWNGFGVSHSNISVQAKTPVGTLPVKVRVHDPADMEQPIRCVLARSGFLNIGYREEVIGMGGWLVAAAPAPLVQRLQS